MTETLYLRLPGQDDQPVDWLVWQTESQSVIASGQLSGVHALPDLQEHARERQVEVYVAGTEVSMHQVQLPPKSRRHLDQLVPYALEDELAEDIQSLHFAWPAAGQSTLLPVAVVSQEKLNHWLTQLHQAGLYPQVMQPDYFMLPVTPAGWSVAQFGDEVCIRQDTWHGLGLERELLDWVELTETPERIAAWQLSDWPAAPVPPEPQTEALTLELAPRQGSQARMNLLQGPYRQREKRRFSLGAWKFPAYAAGVLVALGVSQQVIQLVQLERQANQLQAEVERVYLEAFPDEGRVVNVRSQINQQLAELQGGSGGRILFLLQALGPAFNQAGLELTVLQYDEGRGELRLQANGESFDAFENFQQQAQAQQLDVSQGQLVSRGGQISGTLTVREAS